MALTRLVNFGRTFYMKKCKKRKNNVSVLEHWQCQESNPFTIRTWQTHKALGGGDGWCLPLADVKGGPPQRGTKNKETNPKEMRVVVDKHVSCSLIMESTLTCSIKKWYLSVMKIWYSLFWIRWWILVKVEVKIPKEGRFYVKGFYLGHHPHYYAWLVEKHQEEVRNIWWKAS